MGSLKVQRLIYELRSTIFDLRFTLWSDKNLLYWRNVFKNQKTAILQKIVNRKLKQFLS